MSIMWWDGQARTDCLMDLVLVNNKTFVFCNKKRDVKIMMHIVTNTLTEVFQVSGHWCIFQVAACWCRSCRFYRYNGPPQQLYTHDTHYSGASLQLLGEKWSSENWSRGRHSLLSVTSHCLLLFCVLGFGELKTLKQEEKAHSVRGCVLL